MKLIDSVKWSGTDCDRREKAEVDSVTVHLPLWTPPSEDAFLVHRCPRSLRDCGMSHRLDKVSCVACSPCPRRTLSLWLILYTATYPHGPPKPRADLESILEEARSAMRKTEEQRELEEEQREEEEREERQRE
ncbi:unnamed protein product [Gadus morhua 'NCC']